MSRDPWRRDRPRAGIVSAAHVLPPLVLDTDTLQQQICTESELSLPRGVLQRVTGIRQRHVAGPQEYPSTLATLAGRIALERAERRPEDLDLLLFASATRDFVEPSTAHVVQHALGSRAHCLDVTNACNSFLNGVDLAAAMIGCGRAGTALVVTGETPSLSMRRKLPSRTAVLEHFAGYTFGDAGAAVVVEAVAAGGIRAVATETHSEHWQVGGLFGGGARHPRDWDKTYFTGAGTELKGVFEKIGPAIVEATLTRAGLGWPDVAKVLVHQVTVPYLDRFAEVTGVPRDKLEVTVHSHGNIASASLPLQLSRVWPELSRGDLVLFVGLGGGVSVMTMLWEKS